MFEEEGETLLRDELVRYAQKFHIQFFIYNFKTIAMLGTRVEMELQRQRTIATATTE